VAFGPRMTDNNEDETATVDRGAYEASASTIPVELAAFRVRLDGEQAVQLSWRTASETSNRGFEIQQRRADRRYCK